MCVRCVQTLSLRVFSLVNLLSDGRVRVLGQLDRLLAINANATLPLPTVSVSLPDAPLLSGPAGGAASASRGSGVSAAAAQPNLTGGRGAFKKHIEMLSGVLRCCCACW